MTELRNMLEDTVNKLFSDLMESGMPESEHIYTDMWEQVEEMGIPTLFLPEESGGFDGCWEDAYIVLSLAGYYAIPLAIAETMLAHKLFAHVGTTLPKGPISIAPKVEATLSRSKSGEFRFSGKAFNVPWGATVKHIIAACEYDETNYLVLLSISDTSRILSDVNIADEPRDHLIFDNAPVILNTINDSINDLFTLGALLRVCQIAGALNSALRKSVEYANERVQFGRPIARFQIIQQQLALLASETAAVSCAAMAACRAADSGDAKYEISAAKLRANRAIGEATSIAHQVHGAIGFTKEYRLHYITKRLMAWRSDYGNDRYWASYLGKYIARRGADNLWSDLTARSVNSL